MIGGGIANLAIRSRIAENKFRVTATSANWNVTYRECRVTLAPILTSQETVPDTFLPRGYKRHRNMPYWYSAMGEVLDTDNSTDKEAT